MSARLQSSVPAVAAPNSGKLVQESKTVWVGPFSKNPRSPMSDFFEMVDRVASSVGANALLDQRIDGRISEKEFHERLSVMIEAAEKPDADRVECSCDPSPGDDGIPNVKACSFCRGAK